MSEQSSQLGSERATGFSVLQLVSETVTRVPTISPSADSDSLLAQ